MSLDECPMRCGHVHFGRCLMWRCHCYGEPNPLIPPQLEVVAPSGDDESGVKP